MHACVDTEGSGHVCEGDAEIGELIVDMTSEPIKDVGALSEDRGGMRVRVQQEPSVRLRQRRATAPPRGHPRGFPVLRKMSWRMSGMLSALVGSVDQESRQLCRERRLFCLTAYMQSQTAPVSCQKWEKTSPSVKPTSNAYTCMSVAEEKAAQRNTIYRSVLAGQENCMMFPFTMVIASLFMITWAR